MPDDYSPDSIATPGRVTINGFASTGSVEVAGDLDWFMVTLTAGVGYEMRLNRVATLDPYLELRNSAGTILRVSDDEGGNFNSLINYIPATSGTYFLAARGFLNATGGYSLTVTAQDDYAQNTSTSAFVNVNGPASVGTINYLTDQDWFRISLTGGVAYQLRMNAGGSSPITDSYLELRNSAGTIIAYDDDSGGAGNSFINNFVAPTTGTYYLSARAFANAYTGNYTVSATAPDDFLGSTATTAVLTVNGADPLGRLEVAGDQDWFRVFLNANVTYVLRVTGSAPNALVDPVLDLHNSAGTIVAFNDDGVGLNSLLSYTPTVTGNYYLAARAYANAYTGAYTVSVDATDDFDFSTGTSGRVYVNGTPTSGRIEISGDRDAFLVTLSAGTEYQFRMTSAAPGPVNDPYIALYPGAGGDAIAWDDDSGDGLNALLTYTPSTSGVYFLAGWDSSLIDTGAYTMSATTADDYFASTATTGAVAVGGGATGRVNGAGDQDWFRVQLSAGTSYTLNLRGAPSSHGTLSDPYIRGVYDAAGNLLPGTANDDFGGSLESRVVFTAPTAGSYYVSAGAYANNIGTYQLDVDPTPIPGDILATTATGASITINGTARSAIRPGGDVDWFRTTLLAGERYVVEQNGDYSSSAPLFDPYFRGVYTAGGALLAGTSNDDYGITLNSRVSFTAPTTGTYYLAAGGYASNQGDYTLTLGRVAGTTDTVGNTTGTAGAVAVNHNVTGRIDFARDIDWYRVTLAAGQDYAIDVRGQPSNAGTLADPNLIGIYNASGAIISGTGADDGPGTQESISTFRPATGGTYYLAVGANDDGTGTYRLNIETVETVLDIAANENTGTRGIVGGSVSSAIDTPGDVDWIRVSLSAGVTYRIEQRALPTNEGTLGDPLIRGVFRSGQALPGSGDDSSGVGTNALVMLTASQSGDYFIATAGFGAGTGSYQAWVRPAPDDTAPLLQSTLPGDNATGVPVGGNLSLVFNEAVRAGTGNILVTGGGTTRTISVTDTNQVSFSGEVVTINPTANLAPNTAYAVTMASGVVEDIADNPFGGISTNTRFNFTTASASAADRWTIMVYMAADNDLEGAAIADLNEMEAAILPSNVNLAVLVDRAPGYDSSNANWTVTRRGMITHDSDLSTISSNLTGSTEQNMGSGTTLTNFINWAASNHPAQRYGLIIWDHGGGISGTSWDDSSGGDNLRSAELRTAVDNSNVAHFDLIGFDACLQGMVEQVWDVRNLANVVVASEELEPGDGWEYDRILPLLAANPDMNAANLASAIVTTYGQRYAGLNDITLSAVRTDALTALDNAIDNFVAAVGASPNNTVLTQLRTAASHATPLGQDSLHYRDLGDFMDEVFANVDSAAIDAAANAVGTAVDNAVIARSGTVADAHGLSIYLPFGRDTVDSTYTAANQSYLGASNWDNFLGLL